MTPHLAGNRLLNFKAGSALAVALRKEEKAKNAKKAEEEKKEVPSFSYSKYYKEFMANLNSSPKHDYSCSLQRAIYTDESFGLYKKY